MDRVEPQRVDVVLVEPVQRVPDEEPAYLVASRAVDVDPVAPRRVMELAQVGAEALEVVALGPEVVVDDVEHDREAARVAGVDEAPEAVGAAVGRLGRPQVDAVVAPVARARELPHGHDLAGADAERDEVVEPLDRTVERAGLRERADVELVDHELRERGRAEPAVAPREGGRVDERRRSVDASRAASATRDRAGRPRRRGGSRSALPPPPRPWSGSSRAGRAPSGSGDPVRAGAARPPRHEVPRRGTGSSHPGAGSHPEPSARG